MKKRCSFIVVMMILVMALTGCKKDPFADMTTEAPVTTTEATTEEVTDAPTVEPTEAPTEEAREAGSSMRQQAFSGNRSGDALKKYGRMKFDSTFANIGSAKGITYIYVGDGVEIYHDEKFVGWFAAWDFSEMGELVEFEYVGYNRLEFYITCMFGNGKQTESVERTTLSNGVLCYEFKLDRLTDTADVEWLMEKKLATSETAATKRCTYPVSIYAYMPKDSYIGYLLYLERSTLDHDTAGAIAESITFAEDAFTDSRLVPMMEKGIQETYCEVELKLPHQTEMAEIKEWFAEYNGEKILRIAGTKDDSYSPSTCPDVIFYSADGAVSREGALATMFEEIMKPLTVKSDTRPFTVTKYALGEQKLIAYEDRENMWILPYLNGYYAYEGSDLVSMETVMQHESDIKDGMVPLMRQGSNGTFQFILVKEGNVYRLQRAVNMGLVKDALDWK